MAAKLPKLAAFPLPGRRIEAAICAALALLGAVATLLAPASPARLALVAPTLLFVPGHLALRLVAPRAQLVQPVRALAAVSLSPLIVALCAVSCGLVPGGFRPVPIVLVVTSACLLLSGAALMWGAREPPMVRLVGRSPADANRTNRM